MFEEIVKILGAVVADVLDENTKEESDSFEQKDENVYYHRIVDKYRDGKHVSHKEKEVKDGKVLKDVDEHPEIEDKEKVEENTNLKNLIEEAHETIKRQNEEISSLRKKLAKIENALK